MAADSDWLVGRGEWGVGVGSDEPGDVSQDHSKFPPAHSPLPTCPRVLLADDNADMREYVSRLLRGRFEVQAVADGQAALESARANPPDLVLTDVMMPKLDGFGLLRALREHPATAAIPIIMLSARAGEESRVEGVQAGADDYLIKPFSARELLARVETHAKMARMRRDAQVALRESEARFRNMADTAPAMLWVTEPDGSASFLSRGWYEFTGQTEEEGLGRDGFGWLDAVHPEDRERAGGIFLDANVARRPFTLEYRLRRHNGEYRWAIDAGRPRFGPNGEFLGYIGSVLDIIERKQAEEALAERQRLLKSVTDNASVALFIMDERQHCVFMNPAAETLTGFTSEQVRGRPLHEFIHHTRPDGRPYPLEKCPIDQAFRSDNRMQGEEIFIHPDGRFYDVAFTASPIPGPNGQHNGRIIEVQDITERKAVQERLRSFTQELEAQVEDRTRGLLQSQDRLRALATELNLAEQRERKRLAGELHDHLQQILVLGKLKLGQTRRFAEAAPPLAVAKLIKEADDTLSEALKYTRTLVAELSPPTLRDQGLGPSLKWLGEYMKKYDLTVTVTVTDDHRLKLPEAQAVLLFQSVRELLINASKHAGTREAWLTLEERDGQVVITVKDMGAGFDLADAASTGGLSSTFGLFSIRERMKALGG
ncbi:MAG: putative Multi-sensor hybrid histidine kinase, partial [Nitrospira sp.]|nr:putative Multi-sensor hybrid histidine kinase [Nitrospira sp.]